MAASASTPALTGFASLAMLAALTAHLAGCVSPASAPGTSTKAPVPPTMRPRWVCRGQWFTGFATGCAIGCAGCAAPATLTPVSVETQPASAHIRDISLLDIDGDGWDDVRISFVASKVQLPRQPPCEIGAWGAEQTPVGLPPEVVETADFLARGVTLVPTATTASTLHRLGISRNGAVER